MWRAARMAWVDILLDRQSIAKVIGLLAASQTFEMQPASKNRECGVSKQQKAGLLRLQAEIRAYRAYLPEAAVRQGEQQAAISLDKALPLMGQAITDWVAHIQPLTEQSKRLNTQLAEQGVLAYCLEHISQQVEGEGLLLESFDKSVKHKPFIGLGTRKGLSTLSRDDRVLLQTYLLPVKKQGSAEPDIVFVGLIPVKDSKALERSLHATGAQFAKIPADLEGSPHQALSSLRSDIKNRQAQLDAIKSKIDAYSATDQIELWHGQLFQWLWLSEVMDQAWCDKRFVQICGWVPEQKLGTLESVLQDSGSPYLLSKGEPDEHGEPPVLLNNTAWLKPFEFFVRSFGVPRANEIDPTPMLGLATPLMFGFMFGDVGQGMVLVLLGYALRNRLPILGLLIPAGISSVLFGFMHGTIFCYEGLFAPLWLHPLDDPLTIMSAALLFGAFMLLSSLALAGVQAWWERRTTAWLARQLPLMVLGLALPAVFWNTTLAAVLMMGAVLISITMALWKSGSLGALVAMLKLLEDGMQLAINMLSFIRLGAFTLAHCGLSSAVMVLTSIPDSAVLQFLIFVLGNILVIALEGLVVAIQTTRLVMFEFFRRFMEGEGRPFEPLKTPTIS